LRGPVEPGQYTSIDYAQVLDDHRVLASIGSVGDAYDNALSESLVDSYKTELISDRVWRTKAQIELASVEYVSWFNHERLHEALGDIPPVEFEQHHVHELTPNSSIRSTDRSRRSRPGPQTGLGRVDSRPPASIPPSST
jgi:putative transposase